MSKGQNDMGGESKKPSPVSDPGYEKQDVSLAKIALFGILGTVVLVGVVLLLVNYFTLVREKVVYEEVLRPESTALRDLRARETEELNSYAVLDSAKGVYRIPIERAMKLWADEAFQAKNQPKREGR